MRNVLCRTALTAMVVLAFPLLSSGPADLGAQESPQTRGGFWGSVGLGYGSLGIEGFSDREEGLSGNLTLGGTLSPRVLLGGGTTGWTKDVDGLRVTFSTLALMARFYTAVDGGFFINAGLGGGQVSFSEGSASISESGGGAILGLGYDARVGTGWSLTPYANVIGLSIEDATSDIFQFGLGVTWH